MNAVPKDFGTSRPVEIQLKVSPYDRTASLLVSLLILSGVAVTLLLIVWLTQTFQFRPHRYTIIEPPTRESRQSQAAGFGLEMEMLEMDEVPELSEPQLATELQAVTQAVATVAAATDVIATATRNHRSGAGTIGAEFPLTPYDDDLADQFVPRWQRWQVRWTSASLPAYTRQLDYFKIEIAAAGGGRPLVDYASRLSTPIPSKRQGAGRDEKRLYMTWKTGTMREYDQTILARAGIPTDHRLLMQFYPAVLEDQLAWLEKLNGERLGHSDPREFRKTYFAVRSKGKGFEFFVEDQQFRPRPQ